MSKRLFLIILSLVVVIIAIFYGYRAYFTSPTKHSATIPSIPVEIASVKMTNIPLSIQTNGTLQADQQVDISSQYAGQVAHIFFTNGERVKVDQPLMQLDDTDAKAQLQSATANLTLRDNEYQRILTLFKRKAVSKQALDQAKADFKQQQALVDEKRNIVNKMLLRAPFTGKLTSRTIDVGQYVAVGQTLVTLVKNQPLKVSYQVPEAESSLLKLGQKVTLTTDAYPGESFTGTVNYIAPLLSQQTRTVEIHAIIPNQNDRLKPGMFVDITQVLALKKHVITIPIAALVTSLGGDFVYLVKHGKAARTNVQVGIRWLRHAEITQGLTADEQVVIAGQQLLRDGIPVKVVTPHDSTHN